MDFFGRRRDDDDDTDGNSSPIQFNMFGGQDDDNDSGSCTQPFFPNFGRCAGDDDDDDGGGWLMPSIPLNPDASLQQQQEQQPQLQLQPQPQAQSQQQFQLQPQPRAQLQSRPQQQQHFQQGPVQQSIPEEQCDYGEEPVLPQYDSTSDYDNDDAYVEAEAMPPPPPPPVNDQREMRQNTRNQRAVTSGDQLLTLENTLSEQEEELARLDHENEVADEELAELEKAVATERREVENLAHLCVETRNAYENMPNLEDLQQTYTELDSLMEFFTDTFEGFERMATEVSGASEAIRTAFEEREAFLASNNRACEELIQHLHQSLESISSKTMERIMAKKTADERHAAEIAEFDADLSAMRSTVSELDKSICEDCARLNSLKEELVNMKPLLDESADVLREATEKFNERHAQFQQIQEHEPQEVEALYAELKDTEEEYASVQQQLEAFRNGAMEDHEQLKTCQDRVKELRQQKATLKEQILVQQKQSEKGQELRTVQLKDLERQLADVMDSLTVARQKAYSERLDSDYMLSKNELDFEKVVASGEDELRDVSAMMKEVSNQMDELDDLERQLEEVQSEENRSMFGKKSIYG